MANTRAELILGGALASVEIAGSRSVQAAASG